MTAVVDAARRRHILAGDGVNGGHRPGTGVPGKTEFPHGWSDDRIIQEIESVANDPATKRWVRPDGRTVAEGMRGGLDIRVIVEPDGVFIVTGHPTNLPRNPLPSP